jgi:predicted nucleic acid-binding protein
VGNTVARRFPKHAAAWLSALRKFELREPPGSDRWLTKALELTESYAVSFSDATYHAIAIVHNGLFVTSDTRYINKVVGAAAVVTLSDWQPPRAIPRRGR